MAPGDGLVGDLTTAHPKTLPDGTLVNFTRSLPFGGYHVFRQDPVTLQRTQIAFIPDRNPLAPAWVHDMALSSRHLIIVENPMYFNLPSLMTGSNTKHMSMDWVPQDGTKVHVVALDGSGVKTYDAPPFFSFHSCNAFESADGASLHVDLSVYENPDILNELQLEQLRAVPGGNVSPSALRRLTIPLGAPAGSVRLAAPQPLIDDEASYGNFFEFPVVNAAFKSRAYRYAYGMAAVRPTNMGNALAKFDLQTRSVVKVWHEPGGLTGEAAFVPAPGVAAEDAGVLLAPLMCADGSSWLLALDATSMQELGRARLPFAVPYRFHGCFMPAAGK